MMILDDSETYIQFDSLDRQIWIRVISETRNELQMVPLDNDPVNCNIYLNEDIKASEIEPFHVVLLACFIDYIESKRYEVELFANEEVGHFFFEDVHIAEYINNRNVKYIPSPKVNVLNLWKLDASRTDERSIVLTQYLQSTHFRGYDLSGFRTALNEMHFNVVDHSKSVENAFSYMHYDMKKSQIKIAICDFGVGICNNLRGTYSKYISDEDALLDSINVGVSSYTNPHNRGFGLDNIISNISNGGSIRIVSNRALLYIGNNEEPETYGLNFEFRGTLIYFTIPISNFSKEKIVDYWEL